MGTSNFHSENSKGIYAIGLEWEDDDAEFFFQDEVDYVCEQIKDFAEEQGWDVRAYHYAPDIAELRSYPSRYLFTISTEVETDKEIIDVSLNFCVRSGYYEGANFDWTFDVNVDWTSEDEYEEDDSLGYDILDKMEEGIAEILSKATMPLGVVARFSNGETIYKAVAQ